MKEHITLCKTNNHEFMALWTKICMKGQQDHDNWIKMLRSNGIIAAHPDDGWVEENRVCLCYPQFNDGIAIGKIMALGQPGKYRLVKITGRIQGMFLDKWKYEKINVLELAQMAMFE